MSRTDLVFNNFQSSEILVFNLRFTWDLLPLLRDESFIYECKCKCFRTYFGTFYLKAEASEGWVVESGQIEFDFECTFLFRRWTISNSSSDFPTLAAVAPDMFGDIITISLVLEKLYSQMKKMVASHHITKIFLRFRSIECQH